MCSGSEAGSYLRLIDWCITQVARVLPRTCMPKCLDTGYFPEKIWATEELQKQVAAGNLSITLHPQHYLTPSALHHQPTTPNSLALRPAHLNPKP